MLAGNIWKMKDECIGSAGILDIHPPWINQQLVSLKIRPIDLHCLPVEVTLVLDASPVWKFCEIYRRKQRFQIWKEFIKRRCVG